MGLLDRVLDLAQRPQAEDLKPVNRPSAPPPDPPPPTRHDVRDHVSGRFISVRNGRVVRR